LAHSEEIEEDFGNLATKEQKRQEEVEKFQNQDLAQKT
jgi:hypothetical protein